MNVGKKITDFYCNGFFGRRYDLTDSIIEGEGEDWIVIRIPGPHPEGLYAPDGLLVEIATFSSSDSKNDYIKDWT